jgi:hypothetical protein
MTRDGAFGEKELKKGDPERSPGKLKIGQHRPFRAGNPKEALNQASRIPKVPSMARRTHLLMAALLWLILPAVLAEPQNAKAKNKPGIRQRDRVLNARVENEIQFQRSAAIVGRLRRPIPNNYGALEYISRVRIAVASEPDIHSPLRPKTYNVLVQESFEQRGTHTYLRNAAARTTGRN